MRTYELVIVYDPALEVELVENDLRKLNDSLAAGGLMRRWERWGKRRLSFEIKGRQYGYYVLAVFDAEASAIAELDRTVRINSSVIRHLITMVDPKRVPEVDAESVRTLGAALETTPVVAPPEPVVDAALAAVPEAIADVPAESNDPDSVA